MSGTQDGPIMDGADDASQRDELAGLIEQVENDHGDEGAGSMADHLRNRTAETQAEPEEPGDAED
jgi:hypothetical protein